MNFDAKKRKFASVRMSNGGGTRDVKLELSASKEDLLNVAMDLFFPRGKSPLGNKDAFEIRLGNFSDEEIHDNVGDRRFTLGSYCDLNKLSHVRVYLLTRRIDQFKRLLGDVNNPLLYDSDDELLEITHTKKVKKDDVLSVGALTAASIPTTDTFNIPDDVHVTIPGGSFVNDPMSAITNSVMIGTSDERAALDLEISKAYEESLRIDRAKKSTENDVTSAVSVSSIISYDTGHLARNLFDINIQITCTVYQSHLKMNS